MGARLTDRLLLSLPGGLLPTGLGLPVLPEALGGGGGTLARGGRLGCET